MFFVDTICQQYFIPILQNFQHFLSQIQRSMFSFMQNKQTFIVGKQSTMVENCKEKPWCCMLEEIFDFSSFEDNIEISKWNASKIYNMTFSKLPVDEELAKKSSHFELISTILESMHCWISMKMLIKIEILSFRIFYYCSMEFMIEMLIQNDIIY